MHGTGASPCQHERLAYPDDLLDPPAELFVGQRPHDLNVGVTIEGLGCELALRSGQTDDEDGGFFDIES